MMDILMSETCWAHKKWNKIASDIQLVFHSSTTHQNLQSQERSCRECGCAIIELLRFAEWSIRTRSAYNIWVNSLYKGCHRQNNTATQQNNKYKQCIASNLEINPLVAPVMLLSGTWYSNGTPVQLRSRSWLQQSWEVPSKQDAVNTEKYLSSDQLVHACVMGTCHNGVCWWHYKM